MALRLLAPDERPALAPGQPLVWACQASREAGRAGLRRQVRLLLAELLCHYLGQPADRLGLVFEAGQPPRLATSWQGLRLSLSLSYCDELAAVALCPGADIGIDLTAVTPLADWEDVARLYLGPQASARLARLEAGARAQQFAQDWAGMEAASKCLGSGLEEWSPARQQRLQACQLSTRCARWPDAPNGAWFAWALARRRDPDR